MRSAGFGPQSAEYEADSRDVVPGAYESVVVAPPNDRVTSRAMATRASLFISASSPRPN